MKRAHFSLYDRQIGCVLKSKLYSLQTREMTTKLAQSGLSNKQLKQIMNNFMSTMRHITGSPDNFNDPILVLSKKFLHCKEEGDRQLTSINSTPETKKSLSKDTIL